MCTEASLLYCLKYVVSYIVTINNLNAVEYYVT